MIAACARDLLRRQFRIAHEFLEAAIDGCPVEWLRRRPPGCGGDAAAVARYARAVLGEDIGVNGVLAGGAPLALSTRAGRTGLSELPPCTGPADALAGTGWTAWARRVRYDLDALRGYARVVYASTDAYIATLPGAAFRSRCRGAPPYVLTALLLSASMRCGEIACLLARERERGLPAGRGR